jgi:hypothetical protein
MLVARQEKNEKRKILAAPVGCGARKSPAGRSNLAAYQTRRAGFEFGQIRLA